MTRSLIARRVAISAFTLALGFALAPLAMADDYNGNTSQQTVQQGSQQTQPENGEGQPVDPRYGTVLPGQPNDGDY